MGKERIVPKREVVDILKSGYQFHFTNSARLPEILSGGIWSRKSAEKIRDQKFSDLGDDKEGYFIWTTYDPKDVFMSVQDARNIVAVAIDLPKNSDWRYGSIMFRVAPRKFAGLLVIDTLPIDEYGLYRRFGKEAIGNLEMKDLLSRVGEYEKLMTNNQKTGQLPIYGISGNLYSPLRLMHEELFCKIVRPSTH